MTTDQGRAAFIADCGHEIPALPAGHVGGTGYGRDAEGRTFCYQCCAAQDRRQMAETGRAVLYLTTEGHSSGPYVLTNWPGTLRIPVRAASTGRHNIAGSRTDVWFSFGGRRWHGVQYGDFSQLTHCRRLKATPEEVRQ